MYRLLNVWWLSTIIGLIMLVFGTIVIINTDLVLSFIIIILGVSLLLNGINESIRAFHFRKQKGWWSYLVYSLLSAIAGALFIFDPNASYTVLVYYLAAFLLLRGISQIIFGIKMPFFKAVTTTTGSIMLVLSAVMFIYPTAIADAIIIIVGGMFSIIGIFMIFKSYNRYNIVTPRQDIVIKKPKQ